MANSSAAKKASFYVVYALDHLHENGASFRELADYLSHKYELPNSYERYIKLALKRGINFGAIGKVRNKYVLKDLAPGVVTARRGGRSKSRSKGKRSRRKRSRGKSKGHRRRRRKN